MGHFRIVLISIVAASLALSCGKAAKPETAPAETPPAREATVPYSAPDAAPGSSPPPAGEAKDPGAGSAAPAAPSPETNVYSAEQKIREVGEIVFMDGENASVFRAGSALPRDEVTPGLVVRSYDTIVTGSATKIELDLASGRPGGATIKLAENTAFYFDSAELGSGSRRTVLQLLSGAIALKVERLSGGSFDVITDNAVLGVRGTTFIVDTIPDGSLLVTCAEGEVRCVDESGAEARAMPGSIVQARGGGSVMAIVAPPSALQEYRKTWTAAGTKAFENRAFPWIETTASAFEKGRADFDTAYAALKGQDRILKAWRDARTAGREPKFTDWIQEKKSVSYALFEGLRALFPVERPFYRLVEMGRYHDRGTGTGKMSDGRSTAEFFESFRAGAADFAGKMSYVREALSLFKYASADSPLGDFFGAKAESLGSGAMLLGE